MDASDEFDTVLLHIAGDDGSGGTVIPSIAANFLHASGASNVEITPASPPWSTKVSGRLLSGRYISVLIRASTTLDGYTRFQAHEIDIGLAGLAPTKQQIKTVSALGPVVLTRLARYAVVVAVHPANPVGALSYGQVAGIFAGQITNWQELGGAPGQINPYGRARGSASAVMFEEFMHGHVDADKSVHLLPRFTDIAQALASDRNGIGYLAGNYVNGLKILALTVHGQVVARPDHYGLRTGDYPLANTVTLYRFARPGSDLGADFIREALSARSMYLLSIAGFEGVEPRLMLPRTYPVLPASFDFARSTENSLRVSTTIRFAAGSGELDEAALAEIHELALYLRRLSVANQQLAHLCYSDDAGDPAKNREVSQRLGEAFADALRREYFTPGQLLPLGATRMLADDTTPAGRRLNRRVETWIRP